MCLAHVLEVSLKLIAKVLNRQTDLKQDNIKLKEGGGGPTLLKILTMPKKLLSVGIYYM